jgi:hypothetical protein
MRSRCCLCIPSIVARQRLGKNSPTVARQRLGRNVTAVTNKHATIEELLDASFSMWPVSYQGKQAISSSQNFLFFCYLLMTGFNRYILKGCHLDVVGGPSTPHDPESDAGGSLSSWQGHPSR